MKPILKYTLFTYPHIGSVQEVLTIHGDMRKDLRTASKVMSLYFRYMFDHLLEHKKFTIPRVGTMRLLKVIPQANMLRFTPRYYKDDKLRRNERILNPRMVGEVLTVKFTEGYVVDQKARFKACRQFRKKLYELCSKTEYGKNLPICQ